MKRHARWSPAYESEAHLCAALVDRLRRDAAGQVAVYPEVGGWDLLLVFPAGDTRWWRMAAPHAEIRVGVEAKLRPGIPMLAQVIDRLSAPAIPDAVALLVPEASRPLRLVAGELRTGTTDTGVVVWEPDGVLHSPRLLALDGRKRLEPPKYDVPGLRAGQPCPQPLTPWREAAIRLAIRARDRGFVTSLDFRELKIDPRWWTGPAGPLVRDGEHGPHGQRRFVVADPSRLPDVGWEAVAEQIRSEDPPGGEVG